MDDIAQFGKTKTLGVCPIFWLEICPFKQYNRDSPNFDLPQLAQQICMTFFRGFLAGSLLTTGMFFILTNKMKSDFKGFEQNLGLEEETVIPYKPVIRQESGHFARRNHYNEFIKAMSEKLGRF